MALLTDPTATHFTDWQGRLREATSPPTDTDPEVLQTGDCYYDTDSDSFYIYDAGTWRGAALT